MQLRFGQVLTRTNSTLSAVRLVRNLSDLHPEPKAKNSFYAVLLFVGPFGIRFRKIPHEPKTHAEKPYKKSRDESRLLVPNLAGHIYVSERVSRECDSGDAEATRTLVREPKAEPETCRERPAQRRHNTRFIEPRKITSG